jgi:hypothetical protein
MGKKVETDESYTDMAKMLASMGGGAVNERLSALLNELTLAVQEHGKPGKITLTIGVKPEGGVGSMIGIVVKSSVTKPQPALPGAIYFAADDGTLHVDDPRQMKLKHLAEPAKAEPRQFRPAVVAGGGGQATSSDDESHE